MMSWTAVMKVFGTDVAESSEALVEAATNTAPPRDVGPYLRTRDCSLLPIDFRLNKSNKRIQ